MLTAIRKQKATKNEDSATFDISKTFA